MNQSIADNIRKIRTLKGLEAKTIADHLSISLSAYTKLERGETQIDISRIASIAEHLGVNPMDILSFSPNNIFEKVENAPIATAVNAEPQFHYTIPREIIDSLTTQLKTKDEQLKQLYDTLQKLMEKMNHH
jgi:transcriptional regulator with XRE-family HTH domain